MRFTYLFASLTLFAITVLAVADGSAPMEKKAIGQAIAVEKRQTTSVAFPASTTTTGVAYSPGPQVGPSSYSAPNGATVIPSSPSNTGPVGGNLHGSAQSDRLGSFVGLGLMGVIMGGGLVALAL